MPLPQSLLRNKSKWVLAKGWGILCLEDIDGQVLAKGCEILCLENTDGQVQGSSCKICCLRDRDGQGQEQEEDKPEFKGQEAVFCMNLSRGKLPSQGVQDMSVTQAPRNATLAEEEG